MGSQAFTSIFLAVICSTTESRAVQACQRANPCCCVPKVGHNVAVVPLVSRQFGHTCAKRRQVVSERFKWIWGLPVARRGPSSPSDPQFKGSSSGSAPPGGPAGEHRTNTSSIAQKSVMWALDTVCIIEMIDV